MDEKNIYHQHIIQKKKKAVTFPALPATTSRNPTITNTAIRAEEPADAKGRHPNVFLTNAPSDSGSVITDEGKDIVHNNNSVQADARSEKPAVSELIKPSVFEADRRDESEEVRLRKEAEERRRRAEEERRRRAEEEEEEESKRKAEEEEKSRKREEDEKRKREEEELMKHREEQQKQREEEDKKRLEEEAETRRKKDLLLARMRAIDKGNGKTNDVAPTEAAVKDVATAESKPKKLPIFLQSESTANKEPQQTKPAVTSVSEDDIFSDASREKTSREKKGSSARSKNSSYSYDFKQTVENLHHGLPAHSSLEDVKEAAAADSSEDLSFGGYKPTLARRAGGRRAESINKDEVSFGGYNPSFGAKRETSRKNSGLDFGDEKKATTEKDQNSVIFGEYKPSLGGVTSKPSGSLSNGDIFGDRGVAARGRRPREFPGKGKSVFGDELLSLENKPVGSPLFGNKSLNKDNSSYPWEKKIDVARRTSEVKEQEDSLLPRRRNLQNIGKGAEKSIPVVDNALDDIDDEIEEVIL